MKIRYCLLSLIGVVLAALLAMPWLLGQERIQRRAMSAVDGLLGDNGTVGAVAWRWWPLPGVVFSDIDIATPGLEIAAAEAVYRPNLLALFSRDAGLGSLHVTRPRITIRHGAPVRVGPLPRLDIIVTGAGIAWPAGPITARLSHKAIRLEGVEAEITLAGTRVKFRAKGRSSFCGDFSTLGRVDLARQYYRLDADIRSIDLLDLVAAQDGGGLCAPKPTSFDLKLRIEGMGADNWQISAKAPAAGITSLISGQAVQVDGFDSIRLSRYGDEYFLTVKRLDIADLATGVSGTVRVRTDGEDDSVSMNIGAGRVNFAAAARLARVVNASLAAPGHLFDVIRGGRADDIRLAFAGPVSALGDVRRYHFSAVGRDIPLYLHGIDLRIDRVSGPVAMKDGVLTGSGLRAAIGRDNLGANGRLLIGLTPDNHAFVLDIDLDVSAVALRDVLSRVVHHSGFRKELGLFTVRSGRVRGNLLLSDNLKALRAMVRIDRFRIDTAYDRVPWTLQATGGELRVEPDRVAWSGIDLAAGGNTLTKSHGTVTWDKGTELRLSAESAELDLTALDRDFHLQLPGGRFSFRDDPRIPRHTITGRATLTGLSFSGRLGDAKTWKYAVTVKDADLVLNTDALPPDTVVHGARAILTERKFTFEGEFTLLDSPLSLSGVYRHHSLRGWTGMTEADGRIGERLGAWLRSRPGVNTHLFPAPPFTVRPLRVLSATESSGLQLQGRVIAAADSPEPVTVDIDIKELKGKRKYAVTLSRGGEKGSLSATITDGAQAATLVGWQGTTRAATLRAVLGDNLVRSGMIDGAFSYMRATGAPARFSGYLEASGLRLYSGHDFSDIIIDNLRLHGEGNTLAIDSLDIGFADEPLHVAGTVRESPGAYDLDLDLTAAIIHWPTISRYLDLFNQSALKQDGGSRIRNSLRGVIRFSVDEFFYPRPTPESGEDDELPPPTPKPYRFSPLSGTATYHGDRGTTVRFDASELCGMRFSGTWYSEETGRLPRYTVVKDNPASPLLEESLPCLFSRHSVIEGPYTLKAKVLGYPGDWRDGFLVFESKQGIIRKMNLLSRIFSVINFTDLFTYTNAGNGDNTGLPYSNMVFEGHVEDNELLVDQAVLKGKGVNISGRGSIDLDTQEGDLTFFVAPFKMIDSIINKIPIIRTVIGGRKKSILTIPVAVQGPLADPDVTAMDPASVGSASLEFIVDTLTSPIRLFLPEKERDYDLDDETPDAGETTPPSPAAPPPTANESAIDGPSS